MRRDRARASKKPRSTSFQIYVPESALNRPENDENANANTPPSPPNTNAPPRKRWGQPAGASPMTAAREAAARNHPEQPPNSPPLVAPKPRVAEVITPPPVIEHSPASAFFVQKPPSPSAEPMTPQLSRASGLWPFSNDVAGAGPRMQPSLHDRSSVSFFARLKSQLTGSAPEPPLAGAPAPAEPPQESKTRKKWNIGDPLASLPTQLPPNAVPPTPANQPDVSMASVATDVTGRLSPPTQRRRARATAATTLTLGNHCTPRTERKHQSEIEKLNRRIARLKEQLNQRNESKASNSTQSISENEQETLAARIQQQHAELAHLKESRRQSSAAHLQTQQQLEDKISTISQAHQRRIAELEAQLAAAQKQPVQTPGQDRRLKRQLERVNQEHQQEKQQIQREIESNQANYQAKIDMLEQQLAMAHQNIDQAVASFKAEHERETEKYKHEIAGLMNKIEILSKQEPMEGVTPTADELEAAQREADQLRQRLAELEIAYHEKEAQQESWKKARLRDIWNANKQFDEERENLEKGHEQERQALQDKLKKTSTEVKSQKKMIQDLENKYAKLQQQRRGLDQVEVDEYGRLMEERTTKLKEKEEEVAELEHQIEWLSMQQAEQIENHENRVQQLAQEHSAQVNELERKLAEASAQVEKAQKEAAEAQAKAMEAAKARPGQRMDVPVTPAQSSAKKKLRMLQMQTTAAISRSKSRLAGMQSDGDGDVDAQRQQELEAVTLKKLEGVLAQLDALGQKVDALGRPRELERLVDQQAQDVREELRAREMTIALAQERLQGAGVSRGGWDEKVNVETMRGDDVLAFTKQQQNQLLAEKLKSMIRQQEESLAELRRRNPRSAKVKWLEDRLEQHRAKAREFAAQHLTVQLF